MQANFAQLQLGGGEMHGKKSLPEGRPVIKQYEKTNTNRKGQRMKVLCPCFCKHSICRHKCRMVICLAIAQRDIVASATVVLRLSVAVI